MNGKEQLADWLTYGRTVLCQKDSTKGNTVDNYRPITCLPLLWKLLTGIISEHLYRFLEGEKILPEEKKILSRRKKNIVKEKAEEVKIRYYWTKQCSETAKGEVQTWQWLE